MALITAFAVAALLFMLTAALLELVARDHQHQAHQRDRDRAYFAARSGVEYLSTHGLAGLAAGPGGTKLLPVERDTRCLISVDSSSGIMTFTGDVLAANGRILETRVLQAPGDNLFAYSEPLQAGPHP